MRRPSKGSWSLERVYSDIWPHLANDFIITTYICGYLSKGIFNRIFDATNSIRYQGDINHITGDVHYLTYFLKSNKTVLTILDCVTIERLNGLKRWFFWLLWFWIPEKRCVKIVAISESTRQQILKFVKCDSNKVKVIYCPVSPIFEPKPKIFNSINPKILHIGTSNNKNLERHVKALKNITCELVIIGSLSPYQYEFLENSGIKYSSKSGLSIDEIYKEYKESDLLLFASTYEGFGLPIVEAQAVGRVVITSSLWSMPEVAGDAACIVDPFDINSIKDGVQRIINDSSYREQLINAGFKNIKRFQVENIAKQYESLYCEILT